MKTRILLSALFAVCRMCSVAAPAEEAPAPAAEAPAAEDPYNRKPVEDAKDPPPCNPAEGPRRTLHVRMHGDTLRIGGSDKSDQDGLSIDCREFTLHFNRDNNDLYQVVCRGEVRMSCSESWAGYPACRIRADMLRVNCADATVLLASSGKRPCLLEFVIPKTGQPSRIVADQIQWQLRDDRIDAKGGNMSVVLPESD